MYTPVDPKVDFPKQEEAVLRFWEDHDVFKSTCFLTARPLQRGCRILGILCRVRLRILFRVIRR